MFDFKPYNRLPDHLPWLAYDDESQTFLLDGNYIGFTISALPLSGFDSTIAKRFTQLVKYEYPKGTFLQFNLLVLDDVSDHLTALRDERSGSDDPLIATATTKTIDFIRAGASGGVPRLAVRNSNLLISFKMPTAEMLPDEDELLAARRSSASCWKFSAPSAFPNCASLTIPNWPTSCLRSSTAVATPPGARVAIPSIPPGSSVNRCSITTPPSP